MKILHVFDHSVPIQDGYATRSWAILQEQKARGWQVLPVTGPRQGSSADGEDVVSGITFRRTWEQPSLGSQLPVLRQIWTIWLMYRRLNQLIPELRPDVVHAHSPALNGVAAYWAARRFGLPLVYEVRAFWEDAAVDQGTSAEHGLRYRLTRALENHVFRRAHRVVAICEGLRLDIEARQLCGQPVAVVPNAVEHERFALPTARDTALAEKHGLQLGHTLGFIGSFYDYEGLDLAIRAMPGLLAQDPDMKLVLVGGGLQEHALRELVRTLGLQQQVVFTGKIPFAEVEHYYSVIDVLVYPRKSLRLTETVTPLKPLEAMAQRRVFVASNVGGHRELIKDGETGVLFKADDVDALVEAVRRLLSNPELQRHLQANGERFVREERNWRSSVAVYDAVYAGAVKAAAPAH
ncbi:glycosyltransferase, exosortase A system-associated [Rhodococcus sp. SRB_17]|uniref:TIGR04063 family PEP-CTERM/XrtA system glycosyltransferase n=1 Tax=Acidovorax sp. SRB_24 TaxID=1962700 RepID=UPI00145EB33A|nr:TIGR04063 family PEP-CTERM/XrtA system glycosyltransferase [Acidovorax sp. SRB_24]NMM75437.1 glycosyltransferase, exosortase A system-associated [Acidovorax sp. SRB_24]NMM86724.1 glycosyltransferase, exosortase A system-associated [Rhodococcus sp. SRB_17]